MQYINHLMPLNTTYCCINLLSILKNTIVTGKSIANKKKILQQLAFNRDVGMRKHQHTSYFLQKLALEGYTSTSPCHFCP